MVRSLANATRLFFSSAPEQRKRDAWLRYGRWLVLGLTFQLASDIIETSITTEWEALVRLAAIAVIRTFLNFFLERDLQELRTREAQQGSVPAG